MKIYIDQGHNPRNPNAGAEGNGLREQDITYKVGVELAEDLQAAGIETRLSRPLPTISLGTSNASSLAARVNDANSWGADYFISLHTNASEIESASGSEGLVYALGTRAAVLSENILEQLERIDRTEKPRNDRASVALRSEKDSDARGACRNGIHNKPVGRLPYGYAAVAFCRRYRKRDTRLSRGAVKAIVRLSDAEDRGAAPS